MPVAGWEGASPQFTWRPSQRHLLDIAGRVEDRRWHLCAPPGAGKTLIGLELARQLAQPTLALAPTTAIRDQWRASTAMFGADPATFTSQDALRPVPLIAATYQLLGNPGTAAAELRAAARRLWSAEVALEVGTEEAIRRIEATEAGDPDRARRELRRHLRILRRSLHSGEDVGIERELLLGTRTMELIEQLDRLGIGCVILDECHHLLDWWALVVAALVERLGHDRPVAVIGLTATLPEPGSARESDNYTGLLGAVDAELHLAAMVAEGAVAPWRDGVRLTPLTDPEAAFLDGWSATFATELDELLAGEAFVEWSVLQVAGPALDALDTFDTLDARDGLAVPVDARGWDEFWDRDPLAAAALARSWGHRGLTLPAGFAPPPGAAVDQPLDLDDRLTLLDAWIHDPASAVDEGTRAAIAEVTARYGVAMTTNGPRWGRSVADLVAARSSAKGPGAARILAAEAAARGERLRALVVVERDQASTPPAAARAILGEDAGTLSRVVGALCADADVIGQGVIAVTGRGAWADAVTAERLCSEANLGTTGGRWVRSEGCDIPGAVRLVGEGSGWSSSLWLGVAEQALDAGTAKVLVATRGLVGEGWDHPALNVLIDLSEVASRTAATQLRGRAIRIDPDDDTKLTSLWDVAVVHPTAKGDYARLRRRHDHWWGPDSDGNVVTGAAKLHPMLARTDLPSPVEAERINADSAAAMADRRATGLAWSAVDPSGFATSAVTVRPRHRRRVRTRSARWPLQAAGSVAGGATASLATVGALENPALLAAGGGRSRGRWSARPGGARPST